MAAASDKTSARCCLRVAEDAHVLLEEWGWDAYFEAMWNALEREAAEVPARVVSQQRSLWRIAGEFGECWATPSGKLRESGDLDGDWPAVGDWVAAQVTITDGRTTLHAVLQRRSQFVRKMAGKPVAQQVIAANVDTAFLVAALDGDFNLRRLERYLAQCWESGASPVIVLNKADECDAVAARVAEVESIARGVPVLPMSAQTGSGMGALDALLIPNRTVVLLGSSGVGKSTLVNRLLGHDSRVTQPVRESDSRGRHTTTARQLLRLPTGALVIDTPGLRELQLWDAADGLAESFADIEEVASECRFRDCRHEREPGCAVLAAIGSGTLDRARWENRRKLQREQEFLRRKMDPEARHESQQKLKVLMRGVKQMYGQREKDRGKR
jgi:ribosome biogenesis GTPase / thiamine phosphate phosphatase